MCSALSFNFPSLIVYSGLVLYTTDRIDQRYNKCIILNFIGESGHGLRKKLEFQVFNLDKSLSMRVSQVQDRLVELCQRSAGPSCRVVSAECRTVLKRGS